MRRLWLVATLLAASGCKGQSPSTLSADQALPDCKLADDVEARIAAEVAKDYFVQEVGVEVASMEVEAASVCKDRLVVPIEATVVDTEIPRVWFVEIDRNNPKSINLIRPE